MSYDVTLRDIACAIRSDWDDMPREAETWTSAIQYDMTSFDMIWPYVGDMAKDGMML